MNNSEISKELEKIQKDLTDKEKLLEKTQNSKLKIFIFLTLLGPIFQYIPLRRGSLIENYGFPNGLIYYYVGCLIILPIVYYITLEKMSREIIQMEKDIEMLERKKVVSKK
jgi:hypothetical protein